MRPCAHCFWSGASVERITWAYKLDPETINLPAKPDEPEIEVFEITLKLPDVTPSVHRHSDGRIALSVPIQIKRRNGRKQMTLTGGKPGQPGKLRPWDVAVTPLQLALARATGGWPCWSPVRPEIAALEGIDNSYVSRMVDLTTLAPDIVEAILEDALQDHLTLFDIAVDPPALWEVQRLILTAAKRSKS